MTEQFRKDRQVAIVNFNTPELVQACIISLRKHGGEHYTVTVFDNSDERPFTRQMDGVTVIDNTKGQVIDFEAEIEKFPNRCSTVGTFAGHYGSCRHMMTIQKLWDILPDGFLLLDSDVLIRQNVDFMWQTDRLCVGHVQDGTKNNHFGIDRLVPFLCYINVPLCRKWGIQYFDPKRNRGLVSPDSRDRRNWYDTGASFLEDVKKSKALGRRIDIRPLMLHRQAASWTAGGFANHALWLLRYADLWRPATTTRPSTDKVALCAIGRLENRYAREFVEHHLKVGFDKIIIYDNSFDGEESVATALKSYITKGKVIIIDWHNRDHQQNEAYLRCYEQYGSQYAWIAFFDFDEHLHIEGGQTVKDLLADCTADVALVNWKCYGDNGLVKYDKRKLATRFTEPLPDNLSIKADWPENYHVKAFVRGGLPWAAWLNPHCPATIGTYQHISGHACKMDPWQKPDYSRATLHHFVTKTIEEWMTVKVKRGEGSSSRNTELLKKNAVDIFFAYNERTPEKEEWLREFYAKNDVETDSKLLSD